MQTIYVREQGARLSREGGRLVIRKVDEVLGDIPLGQVAQIVLLGNIHVTTPLVTYCLQAEVEICFLSSRGVFRGRLGTPAGKDGRLRQEQYRHSMSEELALALARPATAGKLNNQMAFWLRRRPENAESGERLRAARDSALAAPSLEALRGVEGSAAAAHFLALADILPPKWGFAGDRDRPARDPVNAMLNLGYTLLYSSMLSAVEVAGLDAYIGFFHQPHHGHAALVSDLIEEFRAPIVDALVTGMIHRSELTPSDFRTLPGGETRFADAALAKFLVAFDARLETQARCPRTGARYTYRQLLERQARQVTQILRGELEAYRAYRWDY